MVNNNPIRNINIYGHKGKPIDKDTIDKVIVDYATGCSINLIHKKYDITANRVNQIIKSNQSQIDDIRREYTIKRNEMAKSMVLQKRADIIEAIDAKSIGKASLSQKTAAAVDLTQINRLESGQSTSNIAVNINSADDLIRFIKGDVVNTDDTPSNQIDYNASDADIVKDTAQSE